ncbi:hypothetical protein V2J09_001789 [Rumex salicifolius]
MAKAASSSKATLVSLVAIAIVFGLQMGQVRSQSSCVSELSNLNVCAPFVVPGNNANPNAGCCGALQAVDHDCLCNTMRIIAQLPSKCNVPPVTCSNTGN